MAMTGKMLRHILFKLTNAFARWLKIIIFIKLILMKKVHNSVNLIGNECACSQLWSTTCLGSKSKYWRRNVARYSKGIKLTKHGRWVCVFLLHTSWYTSYKTDHLVAIYPFRVFHKSDHLCTHTYKERVSYHLSVSVLGSFILVCYRVDALPQTLGWTSLELTETLEVNLVSIVSM